MKKIFFTVISIYVFATTASAQIPQGTIFAGVTSNLSYSSTSFDVTDDNQNIFNIDLNGGYFVGDNILLGATFGYSSFSFGDIDEFDDSATNYGIFGRYYVNGQIFLGLGYQAVKPEDIDAIGSIPFEAGYAAFITDDITIEPSISYAIGVGDNESDTFVFNIGFGIYFNN